MILWYAGWLDTAQTLNPIILRGVDAAGNFIRAVRLNDISPHTFANSTDRNTLVFGGDVDYRFQDGFLEDGTACILVDQWFPPASWGISGHSPIARFAVDQDGWLYCAMRRTYGSHLKPGVTREQVLARDQATGGANWLDWNDLIETSWYDPYVDFFRIYRENGDRIPIPELHGKPVRAVCVDDAGYFYLAGDPVGENEIFFRKYSRDCTQQWAVELDRWWLQGDYYVPGVAGSYDAYNVFEQHCDILRIGSGDLFLTGYVRWRYTIIYDDSGSSFTWEDCRYGWIRKYNASGQLQWERRFPFHGLSNIVTDGTYFYTALFRGEYQSGNHATEYQIGETSYYLNPDHSPADLLILDASGVMVHTIASPYTVQNGIYYTQHFGIHYIAVDQGKLYASAVSYQASAEDYILIYDTATFASQSIVPGKNYYFSSVYSGGIDAGGYSTFLFDSAHRQYFAKIESDHLVAFDSGGTVLWGTQSEVSANWSVLQTAFIATPHFPALAFGLRGGLAHWEGDRYTALTALSLGLAAAAPRWLRDYVGPPRPALYRARITGTPDLEVPIAWLSVRRIETGLTLSVTVPMLTGTTLDDLLARRTGDLIVLRGVRLEDGTEQLDELARAPLTTIRADWGSQSAAISLEGVAAASLPQPKTRTVVGLQYRNVIDGKRQLRCAPDTYLAVGDTVILPGQETLVVGAVTLTIDPNSATMEIMEATS